MSGAESVVADRIRSVSNAITASHAIDFDQIAEATAALASAVALRKNLRAEELVCKWDRLIDAAVSGVDEELRSSRTVANSTGAMQQRLVGVYRLCVKSATSIGRDGATSSMTDARKIALHQVRQRLDREYPRLVVEADTIEGVRQQAPLRAPQDRSIIGEFVIESGEVKSVEGIGNTHDNAVSHARDQAPAGASVIAIRDVQSADIRKMPLVASPSESPHDQGLSMVRQQFGDRARMTGLQTITPGSNGISGFGRRPTEYEVQVQLLVVVSLSFRVPALMAFALQ